ncbi:hypothetical protein BpHYR1_019572 [Brachionus plicatilis]|uniref:Uncharacterized protein n=1 Tax=Brachionus plicatilis TaxID=10195 RepID=A0A3M7Q3G4_BRAPC|nr:hypothetical protein BpHYR1_019572 [Brachionus plicatilis]
MGFFNFFKKFYLTLAKILRNSFLISLMKGIFIRFNCLKLNCIMSKMNCIMIMIFLKCNSIKKKLLKNINPFEEKL